MIQLPFELLATLTPDQIEAARSYTSDSGMFHFAMQHQPALLPAMSDPHWETCLKLPRLMEAAKSHQLTKDMLLHCGIRNGYASLGCLCENDPSAFVGMAYQYGGVFSTSMQAQKATQFLAQSLGARRVLLTIHAKPGLLCLPVQVLGADQSHEGEVLISAGTRFHIDTAQRRSDGKGDYLHLEISGP